MAKYRNNNVFHKPLYRYEGLTSTLAQAHSNHAAKHLARETSKEQAMRLIVNHDFWLKMVNTLNQFRDRRCWKCSKNWLATLLKEVLIMYACESTKYLPIKEKMRDNISSRTSNSGFTCLYFEDGQYSYICFIIMHANQRISLQAREKSQFVSFVSGQKQSP